MKVDGTGVEMIGCIRCMRIYGQSWNQIVRIRLQDLSTVEEDEEHQEGDKQEYQDDETDHQEEDKPGQGFRRL